MGIELAFQLPPLSSNAGINVSVGGLEPGETVTKAYSSVELYDSGGSWKAPQYWLDASLPYVCTMDITKTEPVMIGNPSSTDYLVVGSVHCSAPLPGVHAEPPLQINQFDFVLVAGG
jgi:hypothetical protein